MNAIEKHFRLLTIRERIEQLEAELVVIGEEQFVAVKFNTKESVALKMAQIHLRRAVDELQKAPTDLETQLTLSIASVPARKRCQEVGSEPTNEGPTFSENVSPFRNR